MPGILTRSNQSGTPTVVRHDSASDFLAAVYPELCRDEKSSGIIFAHALKRLGTEAGHRFSSEADLCDWLRSRSCASSSNRESKSFWLTVWSHRTPSAQPHLDFILSCIDWTLGKYPIFLWAPRCPEMAESTWLIPRIVKLTDTLLSSVPPERVFTVFGMTPLVKAFTKCWSDFTGFRLEKEPIYAACLSFCTSTSFIDGDSRIPSGHQMRLANMGDLDSVAQLCKEFADDSVYFPLTLERGKIEARELIENRQIWVYTVNDQCSTICAVTRTTFNVAAITKVYTTPKYRKMGCAEYLVRYVTRKLLCESGNTSVTLYVGHQNNAQNVYDRVGFVGLCGKDKPEGVEDSLELGFIGADKGHW